MKTMRQTEKTTMKATFLPNNSKHHCEVSGTFIEWINGGDGAHILAPLPGDPCRVVRVWKDDGAIMLHNGPETPAPPTLQPEERTFTPLSLEEAREHLAEAARNRPMGLTWEKIEQMQGGKLRK
jgi:hypothetical protein